ncbi:hypothetical protein CAI21_11235 [Alkalilimnicola ehrlichii]|uniref:Uncharacterized protein n=2 Tax=Alkalilimnicola ehrlichii TaxID=351052 RepID=A0A3E0WZX6_9GAMM|nr:hypothetical protein CAI21_11235 [Alkalilimnicola ehrlichii]RFA38649.1 hypothetical protein CAL65_04785 [Alkalilimnicola ehrlichii]
MTASPLTLDEAERLALERDPAALRHRENARAQEAAADAAGRLPNLMLIGEAMSVPFDDALDSDPMTQFSIGVRQSFPRGTAGA